MTTQQTNESLLWLLLEQERTLQAMQQALDALRGSEAEPVMHAAALARTIDECGLNKKAAEIREYLKRSHCDESKELTTPMTEEMAGEVHASGEFYKAQLDAKHYFP